VKVGEKKAFDLNFNKCEVSFMIRFIVILRNFIILGSLMPAIWSVVNWVPLSRCWRVRGLVLVHYPSCTDSIKPSLQFSSNFIVTMLPKNHFVSRFFICTFQSLFHFLSNAKIYDCKRRITENDKNTDITSQIDGENLRWASIWVLKRLELNKKQKLFYHIECSNI
jgi:hypothetical protein